MKISEVHVTYIYIFNVKNIVIIAHVEVLYQGTADECFMNLASQRLL